jgi:hypothetical protein
MQLFGVDLCKYKDALGKSGSTDYTRIFTVRAMDIISLIIGAYIIAYIFGFSFWKTLIVLFISGIIIHRAFCVRTAVDKLLFTHV